MYRTLIISKLMKENHVSVHFKHIEQQLHDPVSSSFYNEKIYIENRLNCPLSFHYYNKQWLNHLGKETLLNPLTHFQYLHTSQIYEFILKPF